MTCTAEGDFESIDSETALCLYRVAQEALHNVVKHAEARQAEVRLIRTDDNAELTIADDGQGFDVIETRNNGRGLGLVSISERVRLAGGTLSVVAERRKGTQVRVRLPTSPSRGRGRRCVWTIRSDLRALRATRSVLAPSPRGQGRLVRMRWSTTSTWCAVGDGHELLEARGAEAADRDHLTVPGLSGIEARHGQVEQVQGKVIVLTMHHDSELATRALRAGASGFLLKHSAGEELFERDSGGL